MLGVVTRSDKFKLAPNILVRRIEETGKYWVFNTDTGDHFSLNETSFWILENSSRDLEQSEVFKQFILEFSVNENEGLIDFEETIKRLLHEGILQRR